MSWPWGSASSLAPPSRTIVKSLVDDIIMPPIGVVTGGVDFSSIFIPLNGEHYDSLAATRQAGAPTMNIGLFINNVISLIVAFVVFTAIKTMNQLRRKQEEEPAASRRLPAKCS
jgi:large conductance mechanosensitive channel